MRRFWIGSRHFLQKTWKNSTTSYLMWQKKSKWWTSIRVILPRDPSLTGQRGLCMGSPTLTANETNKKRRLSNWTCAEAKTDLMHLFALKAGLEVWREVVRLRYTCTLTTDKCFCTNHMTLYLSSPSQRLVKSLLTQSFVFFIIL